MSSPLPARRRSVLVVPGADERKIAKALASDADEVVLDLEDAVTVDRKDEARALVAATLANLAPGRVGSVAVRVNPARTPWCHLDIAAIAGCAALGSIVLPKVEDAGDIAFVDRLLTGVESAAGRTAPVGVQALIETARGVANVAAIVDASPRLVALIIGYADLAASLGRSPARQIEPWRPIQDAVIVAANSASSARGVQAIDGPYLGIAVDDDFTAWLDEASQLGFDGKWVIHPGQVAAVNAAFTPSAADVSWARRVLAAMRDSELEGTGAVALDGQMLDEAVALGARRILARAEDEPA